MTQELWKPLDGADNTFISSFGNVIRNGITIKPKLDSEGYLRVNVGGEIRRDRVHRFVAKLFVPNPFGKKIVNHKDGNKANNKASNLEWCTERENSLLAAKNGQFHGGKGKTAVTATNESTGEVQEFESQAEAARVLGISDSEINKALRGKRKTSHGYKFRYAD